MPSDGGSSDSGSAGGYGDGGAGSSGGFGGNSSDYGGFGGNSSDYGGFGGLGIGNPGSYGGQSSVGAPGATGGADVIGSMPDYADDFSGIPDTSIAGGLAMGKALGQAMAYGSMTPNEAFAKAQSQDYGFLAQTAANLNGMLSGMPRGLNATLSAFSPVPLTPVMGIGAALAALTGQNAWGGGTTDPEGLGGDGSDVVNNLNNTGEGNFENLLAGLQAQQQDNSVLPPTTNTYEPLVRKLKLRGRTLADLIAQGGA